jgi:hypothetical protein
MDVRTGKTVPQDAAYCLYRPEDESDFLIDYTLNEGDIFFDRAARLDIPNRIVGCFADWGALDAFDCVFRRCEWAVPTM